MKLLIVAHALKESLSVRQAREALLLAAEDVGAKVSGVISLSDGGDGFLDAATDLFPQHKLLHEPATDPLGRTISAPWLWVPGDRTAFLEIARCSGLALVSPHERDIMRSTTAGVGDLLAAAVRAGAKRIIVGLGGSATCDAGLGMLQRFADHLASQRTSRGLAACDLAAAATPPLAALREALAGVELIACSDVDNPLCGPRGSAACFGPQKGATPQQVEELERLLRDAAKAWDPSQMESPGAGAAGGLGYAFLLLGAVLRPGAKTLATMNALDARLAAADLLITCEGRFDETSLHGKAPWYIASRAIAQGRQAILCCGSASEGALARAGSVGIEVAPFRELPLAAQLRQARPLLREAAANALRKLSEHSKGG
jgi:glycerate kinase